MNHKLAIFKIFILLCSLLIIKYLLSTMGQGNWEILFQSQSYSFIKLYFKPETNMVTL